LQVDHVMYLLDDHPDIPTGIIEGLNHSLALFTNQGRHDSSLKEIILTLIMCLGEWCMSVPVEFLKVVKDTNSSLLLKSVMKTLNSIMYNEDILVSETESITLRHSAQNKTSGSVHFPP